MCNCVGICVVVELAALLSEALQCVSVGECQYIAVAMMFIMVNVMICQPCSLHTCSMDSLYNPKF